MTNNLKAERTLTAEELQAIIDGCEGVTLGPWYVPEHYPYSPYGGDDWPLLTDSDNAGLVAKHISRLDPETVKAMALELQHLRSQSLSTQQPMGEVHGPFGYLVGNVGLNEEHWALEMEPVTEKEYCSIPLYAKVDPFALYPNQESGE